MITAASAAAQKLGLKAKQIDVVMGIVSERDVFTTLIMRASTTCDTTPGAVESWKDQGAAG